MTINSCLDCNAYDDTTQADSFLRPFGDDYYICELCAESRGLDAGEFFSGSLQGPPANTQF